MTNVSGKQSPNSLFATFGQYFKLDYLPLCVCVSNYSYVGKKTYHLEKRIIFSWISFLPTSKFGYLYKCIQSWVPLQFYSSKTVQKEERKKEKYEILSSRGKFFRSWQNNLLQISKENQTCCSQDPREGMIHSLVLFSFDTNGFIVNVVLTFQPSQGIFFLPFLFFSFRKPYFNFERVQKVQYKRPRAWFQLWPGCPVLDQE